MYLKANIRIHPNKVEEFGRIAANACEIIKARAGWKLVAALTNVTGRLNEIVHLWEIPDANALTELAGKLKQEDHAVAAKFAECVASEEYQLLAPAGYHPLLM